MHINRGKFFDKNFQRFVDFFPGELLLEIFQRLAEYVGVAGLAIHINQVVQNFVDQPHRVQFGGAGCFVCRAFIVNLLGK